MCHPWGIPQDAYITRVYPWLDKIKERSDMTATRNTHLGLHSDPNPFWNPLAPQDMLSSTHSWTSLGPGHFWTSLHIHTLSLLLSYLQYDTLSFTYISVILLSLIIYVTLYPTHMIQSPGEQPTTLSLVILSIYQLLLISQLTLDISSKSRLGI